MVQFIILIRTHGPIPEIHNEKGADGGFPCRGERGILCIYATPMDGVYTDEELLLVFLDAIDADADDGGEKCRLA